MLRQTSLAALLLALLLVSASADKVLLHDGRSFEGQIVSQTGDSIVIKTRFARMTFSRDQVKEIVKSKTPREFYAERKGKLKQGDVPAHLELAEWCVKQGLQQEAREQAAAIVAVEPDHAQARALLGQVKHEGEWIGRDELARRKQQGGGAGKVSAPPMEDQTKIKTSFASDDEKRKYVDELFKLGKQRFDEADISGARKYWNALIKYFPEAHYVDRIKAHLGIQDEPKRGDSSMGGDEEQQPKEADAKQEQGGYDDQFSSPGSRKKKPAKQPKKSEDDPLKTEKKPEQKKSDPDDPFGANQNKQEDKTEKKTPKENKPDPLKAGAKKGEAKQPKKKTPKKKDPKKEKKPEPKKKPGQLHPDARFFQIERTAIGGNFTTAGTYPEVQLQFKCFKRVKFITIIFYALTKQGKAFWSVHTFFGPEINTVHRKVAAISPKQETQFGRIVAGRVEIYHGTYKERELLAVSTCGKEPSKLRGKRWWDPEEDYDGQMMLYAPKTHPYETNTLKRYRSKH